ncbi:MAG: acylphosphatase [Spirochaetaceae bacterium]|nr:acylphosphatase [Spirochaetaceae bacterium]
MNRASTPSSKPIAVFATLTGRVQGVGFRYSACREGRRLGLAGWVRNTGGSGVEAFFQGQREKAEAFLEWLRRGPPGARVDNLDYSRVEPQEDAEPFTIRY